MSCAKDARAELADLRATALWARLHPNEHASREPRRDLVAGGLAAPAKAAGLLGQTQFSTIVTLLIADASWLASSCTVEQRQLIDGQAPTTNPGAVWSDSAEAVEQDRAEKQAALRRHEEMFGTRPA